MNLRIATTVYRKEMLEVFRDRRTLISMIVIPLAVFPLLFGAMSSFLSSQTKAAKAAAVTIGIQPTASLGSARDALVAAGFQQVTVNDLRKAVEEKHVAVALDSQRTPTGELQYRILEDQTHEASHIAGRKLKTVLDKHKSNLVQAKLRSLGVSSEVLKPFTVETTNVASKEQMGSFVLGRMAGYLMLLLMFTGAMYPAIDTAAGEKERRTLEAILSSPAGRNDILLGKIAACATASFLTAVLSLTGFMLFAKRGMSSMDGANMQFNLNGETLALVLLSVIPVAILAASAMVALSLFARTFKEGQTYTMPFIMIVIFPIVLGTFANVELTPAVALIPVFNVSLVMKTIFGGTFPALGFSISMLANLAFAALAFFLASRIIHNEGALFRT